jgi:ferredoxin-NADP reductase
VSATPTFEVRISSARQVAEGIRELTFTRADGEEFPRFSGGSHIVLQLPLGDRVHRNPYSLVGDPSDRHRWRIGVHRQAQSRGGSAWLHEHARPGMTLQVSWPLNLFPIVRTARHHLLVAGGIGITPILSQARQLTELGLPYELHYAFRSEAVAAFLDELHALGGGPVTTHDLSKGQMLSFTQLLSGRPLGTHFYICGPKGMIDDALATGRRLGWPPSTLHSEQFVTPPGGEPFEVALAKSGLRITVPADLSMLEALERAGVDAPSLCRGGACGQCETEVLEATGELLHHDIYLSADERASGKKIMPCVSRLQGGCTLVLNT